MTWGHAYTDQGGASSMPVATVSVGRKRFGLDAHLASPSHAFSGFLRNRSPILLHAPSAEGVTQRAHNRACASRTRPPSASCTPPDKWLRRDGFMPRLVRCPSSWLDATGSDAAVAERYMSALRLGENPVLAKPQATTTLLAQIVEETVLWICRACKRHYRPF